MSSNLNWMENKVMNPSSPRQTPRTMSYPAPSKPMDPAPSYTAPMSSPATQADRLPSTLTPSTSMPSTPMPSTPMPSTSMPGTTVQGTPLPFQQGFPPATERGYIPYYLASNIGKNVRAEFFIGGSQYSDKVGRLIEVGISYFVLDDVNSRTHVMCDLYSVKFVTVLMDDSCIIT